MLCNFITSFVCVTIVSFTLNAQTDDHRWVNEIPKNYPNELIHESYYSKINKTDIGYTIALPLGYNEKKI